MRLVQDGWNMTKPSLIIPCGWIQPVIRNRKSFQLWFVPRKAVNEYGLTDGTTRQLNISFDDGAALAQNNFRLSSGIEMVFDLTSQNELMRRHENGGCDQFYVEITDDVHRNQCKTNQDDDEILCDIDLGMEAEEGRSRLVMHMRRERSARLVAIKKQKSLKGGGSLDCEICGFNFSREYGDIGNGFIECHHLKPLSSVGCTVNTRLDDLALVCSNCHRVIHRVINKLPDVLSVDQLRRVLRPRPI